MDRQQDIFKYPLPKIKLFERYIALFNGISANKHITIVGMPQSCRSAFFISTIDSSKELFEKEFDFLSTRFVFIHSVDHPLERGGFIEILCKPILKILPKKEAQKIDGLFDQNRFEVGLVETISCAKQYSKRENKKIIPILFGMDEVIEYNFDHLGVITKFLAGYTVEDRTYMNMIFVMSPATFEVSSSGNLSPFIKENPVIQGVLGQNELDYTRKRFPYIRNIKISKKNHELYSKLSAGYYGVYDRLAQMGVNEDLDLEEIIKSPFFNDFLENIFTSLDPSSKPQRELGREMGYLSSKGEFSSSILQYAYEKKDRTTGTGEIQITPQQKEIVDYLLENKGKLVTREDIAKQIWGEHWIVSYSDWALDKQISNVRKYFKSKGVKLATVRGKGIKLETF